jgi:protoheme IX farnesyltransferase
MAFSQIVKHYYSLTKPGVLYGNVLTAAAGFMLASAGHVDGWLLLATLIGTTLVIGSACAVNNYLDQDIDSRMERTKKRVLVQKVISPANALVFGMTLGILGIITLILWTNTLVVISGIIGFITYVWLYGALGKRRSVHGTIPGSVSGAIPIFAGYVAARGSVDWGAVIVFAILYFWQFPEFYSISIYRRREYKAASVPVSSVIRGVPATTKQIFIYTILFVISTLLLTPLGYAGYTYAIVMAALGIRWLLIGAGGFSAKDSEKWARKMFGFSMVIILALCIMLSLGPILP